MEITEEALANTRTDYFHEGFTEGKEVGEKETLNKLRTWLDRNHAKFIFSYDEIKTFLDDKELRGAL